jgi:hypothetical protein
MVEGALGCLFHQAMMNNTECGRRPSDEPLGRIEPSADHSKSAAAQIAKV